MAFWYVRLPNETWGPLTDERIRRYLAHGFVAMDTLVDKGDESTSRPAGQWKELFEDVPTAVSTKNAEHVPIEVARGSSHRFMSFLSKRDMRDYTRKDWCDYFIFVFLMTAALFAFIIVESLLSSRRD